MFLSFFSSLCLLSSSFLFFFFFNDPATTEIYTLSLHDALPISRRRLAVLYAGVRARPSRRDRERPQRRDAARAGRSEEHTSELQSLTNLVCRLLLEKKKKTKKKQQQQPRTPTTLTTGSRSCE